MRLSFSPPDPTVWHRGATIFSAPYPTPLPESLIANDSIGPCWGAKLGHSDIQPHPPGNRYMNFIPPSGWSRPIDTKWMPLSSGQMRTPGTASDWWMGVTPRGRAARYYSRVKLSPTTIHGMKPLTQPVFVSDARDRHDGSSSVSVRQAQ